MKTRLSEIKISPLFIEKLKLKLDKVFFLTAMWILAGLFFSIIEILKDTTYGTQIFPYAGMNKWTVVVAIMVTATLVGLVTGSFQAFVAEKFYGRQYLGKMILYNAVFYITIYFFLFFTGMYIYKAAFSTEGISIQNYTNEVKNYLFSSHALLSSLTFGAFVSLSLFILYAREKFGSKVMSRLLTGKYFYPVEENRVFMFLDIKSATSIAEKLGPLKYHQFLNDFYREITYPILYKKGEIYQYVGDEVTISWSFKNAFKNLNCIECFFEIQNTIQNHSQLFSEKYGVVPEFKAGLHYGKTVAGEIGIIKREIVYSGDTLNTTARIQELCNPFGEKLLISKEMLENLQFKNHYEIKELGEKELRGRKAKISLYGVNKINFANS